MEYLRKKLKKLEKSIIEDDLDEIIKLMSELVLGYLTFKENS